MESDWSPDIVVGIDIGMTCSGVAYSMGPEWPEPKTIQRWPGKLGHELRNKVDTCVSYDLRMGNLTSWGFLCNMDDERFEYNALFKLYLDPDHRDDVEHSPTTEEARRWYRDYVTCLRRYIVQHFEESIAGFERKRVEFVFSVPASWRQDPAMIASLERIIGEAGFVDSKRERAGITMTEPEATAVFASKKQCLEKNDVFIVCDAGGGTTDLNVLKVDSKVQDQITLTPLSWTEGEAVGSTLIDWKIRVKIRERLAPLIDHIDGDLDTVISQMMADKFEGFKCSFGSVGMDVPKLYLPIPGMAIGLDFPTQMVENSRMIITREELRDIFDDQIAKIFKLIDRQIAIVRERHATVSISYIILSGGLGSSPYVQSQVKSRYVGRPLTGISGVDDLRVLVSTEPQLSVVHGLVMARVQSKRGGPEMYSWRCSPLSFGILCREPYDPIRHQGEIVVQDPYDKKRWAEGQINWIVCQGEMLHSERGKRYPYRLKIDMGKENIPWEVRIVSSSLPQKELPISIRRERCRIVCAVETTLARTDMVRKNKHWYNLRKEYNEAQIELRMIVGTGLRFEVWTQNELKSRAHDEVRVQWQAGPGQGSPSSGFASEKLEFMKLM